MDLTECPNCHAPGDQLMELDNGLIYCPVHKGAVNLDATRVQVLPPTDWATATPDLGTFDNDKGRLAVTNTTTTNGDGSAHVEGEDIEALETPEGPPLGLRVGIITACAVLFSTFDFDTDDLVQTLKDGPTVLIPDETNNDVVLRAGVAMMLASVIETFDIEPDEIEVMAETLLGMSDTNTKEGITE